MKFKHTFHVFVDNFSIVYKQLLYRLVILLISSIICVLGVYPFIKELVNSEQLNELFANLQQFISNLLNGRVEELTSISLRIQEAYNSFISLLQSKTAQIVSGGLLLLFIYIVAKWFSGLGNYATATLINDRMTLRANTPFLGSLIRNLKDAAIYNAIYVPLSILYDLIIGVAMFFLLFYLLNSVLYFLLCVFLFVLAIVAAIVVKMTFTSNWLPALIRGKKGQLGSLKYTFARTGKRTANVMSNFTVLVIIIFALNVGALFLTFGAGMLLTIPASYVLLICFEFVDCFDREGFKYFLDDATIVNAGKQKPLTREEFFRGTDD